MNTDDPKVNHPPSDQGEFQASRRREEPSEGKECSYFLSREDSRRTFQVSVGVTTRVPDARTFEKMEFGWLLWLRKMGIACERYHSTLERWSVSLDSECVVLVGPICRKVGGSSSCRRPPIVVHSWSLSVLSRRCVSIPEETGEWYILQSSSQYAAAIRIRRAYMRSTNDDQRLFKCIRITFKKGSKVMHHLRIFTTP